MDELVNNPIPDSGQSLSNPLASPLNTPGAPQNPAQQRPAKDTNRQPADQRYKQKSSFASSWCFVRGGLAVHADSFSAGSCQGECGRSVLLLKHVERPSRRHATTCRHARRRVRADEEIWRRDESVGSSLNLVVML